MLPLLGQAAVARFGADPTGATAQTILVAQLTMVPAVLLAARAAERFGWAPLVVTALIVLSVRGLTAGFWADPAAIYPVQVLDGVAAGVIGVATPGFVAAIVQGGGRANLALGLVILVQGIGAALSNGLAGHAAHAFGYEAAFVALAAAPPLGLAVFLRMVRATD